MQYILMVGVHLGNTSLVLLPEDTTELCRRFCTSGYVCFSL